MRLHLLLSKPPLDRVAESMDYDQASGVRDALVGIEFVHNHFVFDNHRGDPPHARVSLTWTDVEALICREGSPRSAATQSREKASRVCR
jgi:hypothetical protein